MTCRDVGRMISASRAAPRVNRRAAEAGVNETTMRFSGHGLHCDLQFSGADDEGGMRTARSIETAGFEGGFVCPIERGEWKGFAQELRQLQASMGRDAFASRANDEANVELRSTLHGRGTLECNDDCSPNPVSLGPTPSGTFEADQSFLSGWICEAEAVFDDAC